MLKTLQITSLAMVVLAVCGVLLIVFLALREDPEIIAYLEQPGVIAKFRNQVSDAGQQNIESPLVAQAQALALRLNPPPPPPRPTPQRQPERQPVAQRTPPPRPTPQTIPPPVQPRTSTAKFTLLATVMCEENPNRSMVLLRQAGNKDEWFWQGDKIGQLEVQEVRNGTAVFSQDGRNEQVLSVPAKPKTKSLLKNPETESTGSTASTATAGSISVTIDAETGEPIVETAPVQPAVVDLNQPRQETVQTLSEQRSSLPNSTSRDAADIRREVSDRIRRIRTVPQQPTPAEQQEKLETNISRIQQIMNNQSSVSESQKQAENEAWMKLLNSLQAEKERLENSPEQPDGSTNEDQDQTADDTPTENTNEQ